MVLDSLDAIDALEASLKAAGSQRPQIHTLVVGTAEYWPGMPDQARLARIITLAPELRQLILIHADDGASRGTPLRPFADLPFLTDVTIVSSSNLHFCSITGDLLQHLPSCVQFLQLPGEPSLSPSVVAEPPAFKLYALTSQDFSAPATKWILSNSQASLQCLTVAKISNLIILGNAHPNLRSLRLLGTRSTTLDGVQHLTRLERLELRAKEIQDFDVRTFPTSLTYIHIWATNAAESITTFLESLGEKSSTSLKTIAWDYWRVPGGGEEQILDRLRRVCDLRKITLRESSRTDNGDRPGLVRILVRIARIQSDCSGLSRDTMSSTKRS